MCYKCTGFISTLGTIALLRNRIVLSGSCIYHWPASHYDSIHCEINVCVVVVQIQGEALLTGTATGSMYRGVLGTLSTIRSMEGLPGWYSGLAAGLQRQMCFASIRIGLYDPMKQAYMNLFGGKNQKLHGSI